MQLHQTPTTRGKRAQRIARGGKRGTTSGRGQKGQRSRSGHKIRPALRDYIARLPKRRGFKNAPTSPEPVVMNVGSLSRRISGTTEISPAILRSLGLVPARHRGPIKLLGAGSISQALTIKGLAVSKAAREKVIAAGGSIAD